MSAAAEIAQRLRDAAPALPGCDANGKPANVCTTAAALIDAQAAEIARLRAFAVSVISTEERVALPLRMAALRAIAPEEPEA